MLRLRPEQSIRDKLNRVLLASIGLGLFVAGLLLAGFDLRRQARGVERDLQAQADIIGLASLGALAFDDANGARENLSVLRVNPDVDIGALYAANGALLATYTTSAAGAAPPLKPGLGSTVDWQWQEVARPVRQAGRDVGTIYLRARHNLGARALEHLAVLLAILAAALLVAMALARRLQRSVTQPLLALAGVAEGIREGGFRLRAELSTQDEVGALVKAFNAMLDELERRATVLESTIAALQASEERYQLAVRGSSAGLWDWSLRDGTMFYSPRLKELLGFSEDEFPDVPGSLRKVVDEQDVPRIRAALRAHERLGVPYQVEVPVRLRGGERRTLMVAGSSLRDEQGKPFRMAGSVIDITDRKRMEDALRAANEAKDRFLATLAHELRNPLAPIRTGQEFLQATERLSPRGQQILATMQRQLTHLVRLIDDLLDISRITNGKIRLDRRRIVLRQAIDAAVELALPVITKSGHRLIVDAEPSIEVDGDLTRLAQAVGNLLNNAAKYTPPGGRILLRCWRDGEQALVEVTDDGAGIPPEMLEQVFAMFSQVDRTLDRAQGGLGIGLSLVRSLVELHGGSVVAASAGTGHGSTFTIRLPCLPHPRLADRSGDGRAGDTADAGAAHAAGLRILVVDDNQDAAETLSCLLETLGHDVQRAHDGVSAPVAARTGRPDVVLLDIGLPGASGHDVARELRADPSLAGLRIIAVTGWGTEADQQITRAAGFDAHLTKPVEFSELLALLAPVPPPLVPA